MDFSNKTNKMITPKVSICSVFDEQAAIQDILPKISRIGYRSVELFAPHLQKYLDQGNSVVSLKNLLQQNQLSVSCVSSYFTFLEGREKYQLSIRHATKLAQWCRQLGCHFVRVLMDWVSSEDAAPEQWKLEISALQEISDIFEACQVTPLLETHMNQLFDCRRGIERVLELSGRSNIMLNLDAYNMFLQGEDPVCILNDFFDRICYIHLKNGKIVDGKINCNFYMDSGDMDYEPFFCRMRALGFSGTAALEWFGEKPYEAAAHEFEYIRHQLQKS